MIEHADKIHSFKIEDTLHLLLSPISVLMNVEHNLANYRKWHPFSEWQSKMIKIHSKYQVVMYFRCNCDWGLTSAQFPCSSIRQSLLCRMSVGGSIISVSLGGFKNLTRNAENSKLQVKPH